MKEIEEITIEMDAETAQAVSAICKDAGTTIEILVECFMRFSVDPNNLLLLQSFLYLRHSAEADATSRIVIDAVLQMAAEESLRRGY